MKDDMIYRQQAIDAFKKELTTGEPKGKYVTICSAVSFEGAKQILEALPSAQPDRGIPKKPNETTDRTWGIPKRQAVCPNCDAYLGMIYFISENGKTKVTYCESCGQAIDWKGWDFDE